MWLRALLFGSAAWGAIALWSLLSEMFEPMTSRRRAAWAAGLDKSWVWKFQAFSAWLFLFVASGLSARGALQFLVPGWTVEDEDGRVASAASYYGLSIGFFASLYAIHLAGKVEKIISQRADALEEVEMLRARLAAPSPAPEPPRPTNIIVDTSYPSRDR